MTYPRPQNDVAAIRRFFTPTPVKPNYTNEIVFAVIGGVIALVGLGVICAGASNEGGLGAGLCCALPFLGGGGALGISSLVKWNGKNSVYQRGLRESEPKPPATWVRDCLFDDLIRIEDRALSELRISRGHLEIKTEWLRRFRDAAIQAGIPPERFGDLNKPLVLLGPARPPVVANVGTEGVLFSRYLVSVICPTSWQFGIYECVLDLDTGRWTAEQTKQYPYNHVAAVTTRTVPLSWPAPPVGAAPAAPPKDDPLKWIGAGAPVHGAAIEYRDLQIVVSGGDRAVMSLGIVDQTAYRDYSSMIMPSANDVIDAVKANLERRDMKPPFEGQI
jgi:hypothetical protein